MGGSRGVAEFAVPEPLGEASAARRSSMPASPLRTPTTTGRLATRSNRFGSGSSASGPEGGRLVRRQLRTAPRPLPGTDGRRV